MTRAEQYLRAAGIGAVSGMRTMTGPAATLAGKGGKAKYILPLLALSEMIVDKVPNIPARTMPPGLIGRSLAGGFAGYEIVGKDGDRVLGAVFGVAGAIAASYLMLALRKGLVEKTHLPDPVIGLAEDALAAGAGWRLAAV